MQITHFDVGGGGIIHQPAVYCAAATTAGSRFLYQGWHPASHARCRIRLNVSQEDNRKAVHTTRTINSSALTSRTTAGGYGTGARVRTLVPSRILPDASLWKPTAAAERPLDEMSADYWEMTGGRDCVWGAACFRFSPVSVCLLSSRDRTHGLVGMILQQWWARIYSCVCVRAGARTSLWGCKISPQPPILPLPLCTLCTFIRYPFVYCSFPSLWTSPSFPISA